MGMLQNRNPPNLPLAPVEYDPRFINQMLNVLNLFFQQVNAVQKLSVSGLNIALDTLPTEADLADLRDGDVYRDTTADNALKVKV